MSVFGRRRKRRVIPNNIETDVFGKKKAKKETKSITTTSTVPSTISTVTESTRATRAAKRAAEVSCCFTQNTNGLSLVERGRSFRVINLNDL